MGSLNEVEYDLLLAKDLQILAVADHSRLSKAVERVRRMLSGLIARIDDDLSKRGGTNDLKEPDVHVSYGEAGAGSGKPEATSRRGPHHEGL